MHLKGYSIKDDYIRKWNNCEYKKYAALINNAIIMLMF